MGSSWSHRRVLKKEGLIKRPSSASISQGAYRRSVSNREDDDENERGDPITPPSSPKTRRAKPRNKPPTILWTTDLIRTEDDLDADDGERPSYSYPLSTSKHPLSKAAYGSLHRERAFSDSALTRATEAEYDEYDASRRKPAAVLDEKWPPLKNMRGAPGRVSSLVEAWPPKRTSPNHRRDGRQHRRNNDFESEDENGNLPSLSSPSSPSDDDPVSSMPPQKNGPTKQMAAAGVGNKQSTGTQLKGPKPSKRASPSPNRSHPSKDQDDENIRVPPSLSRLSPTPARDLDLSLSRTQLSPTPSIPLPNSRSSSPFDPSNTISRSKLSPTPSNPFPNSRSTSPFDPSNTTLPPRSSHLTRKDDPPVSTSPTPLSPSPSPSPSRTQPSPSDNPLKQTAKGKSVQPVQKAPTTKDKPNPRASPQPVSAPAAPVDPIVTLTKTTSPIPWLTTENTALSPKSLTPSPLLSPENHDTRTPKASSPSPTQWLSPEGTTFPMSHPPWLSPENTLPPKVPSPSPSPAQVPMFPFMPPVPYPPPPYPYYFMPPHAQFIPPPPWPSPMQPPLASTNPAPLPTPLPAPAPALAPPTLAKHDAPPQADPKRPSPRNQLKASSAPQDSAVPSIPSKIDRTAAAVVSLFPASVKPKANTAPIPSPDITKAKAVQPVDPLSPTKDTKPGDASASARAKMSVPTTKPSPVTLTSPTPLAKATDNNKKRISSPPSLQERLAKNKPSEGDMVESSRIPRPRGSLPAGKKVSPRPPANGANLVLF
eukprot:CAMPEP_0184673628 /NCGR_PEP_ID=MMETSP0308-20130426/86783_1 /TAXON_ID=38269 /ORGANISM="Gloeochaete witrockiana, Strain SAG 46.84" /LENGTH=763 /DNA_ID=CAMNT_0027121133 /DNA_START=2134 /DNA_END=4425 /DNA_ORIENTATION=-